MIKLCFGNFIVGQFGVIASFSEHSQVYYFLLEAIVTSVKAQDQMISGRGGVMA